MTNTLNIKSVIVKSQDYITSEMDGETIMMSIQNGNYYSMSQIGTSIWKLLDKPIPIEDICNKLMTEYDVTHEQCVSETLNFLGDLKKQDIITESD